MTVIAHFGRSATVPATTTGADVAPAVTTLREVSVTGAEYPGLYSVTEHIAAEMLTQRISERGYSYFPLIFYTPKVTRAPLIVKDWHAEISQEEPEPEERAETAEPWISYQIAGRLPHLRKEIEQARERFWSRSQQFEAYIGLAFTSSSTLLQEDPLVYEDTAFKLLWAGAQVEPEVESADVLVEPEAHGAAGVYIDRPAPPARPSLLELAEEIGAIPDEISAPVALSGNLTRDVLALTGFTAAELASVVGRTERSVRQWSADNHVPDSIGSLLMQLRTIALRLVGGLGSRGTRAWLLSGEASPAQLIAAGEAQRVLAETDRLLDSPAT